ncbi:uncharacterized protein EV420DRAFT_1642972 [Desarmillaria tabescens]|uniref:F-box domain-containing protein n=1 Tax=Armillaria tabescens TaxID=1929756 RepID=A0AA39KD62_ARMTA|nr:uncharacterized protein EV420DRAFT_1642972 [Desarmillaria tabescens]KAK0458633.1 hypothetical protein EV420DRAFT_1642972 [Desarmillaria tabescens]
MAHRSASLENLLCTNLPPSEREANVLDTRILDAYEALEGLNQEIGKVQATLSAMQNEKKAIFKLITEYKLLLSLVQCLAPEILIEIFRWSIKSLPEGNFNVTDPRSGPWVLTHVSSLWHSVTLGCLELWSSFTICFSVLTSGSREHMNYAYIMTTCMVTLTKKGTPSSML